MLKIIIALFITVGAFSSFAGNGKDLYSQKTCVACHGVDGKKPILPEYPKLAGQNKDYMIRQMADIKDGKRANGNSAAMQGVMHLVSEAEIKEIADYISKVKP